jgi:SHS2 domain-containing protein
VFETFDHTADLGLRVTASDLDELFAEAACGLTSLLVEDPATLGADDLAEIPISGDDLDLLLFDLLGELLFRFETTGFLGREFVVTRTTGGLVAEARGEVIEDQPHRLAREVKAITYHGLKVERQGGRWLAEVIVDI